MQYDFKWEAQDRNGLRAKANLRKRERERRLEEKHKEERDRRMQKCIKSCEKNGFRPTECFVNSDSSVPWPVAKMLGPIYMIIQETACQKRVACYRSGRK